MESLKQFNQSIRDWILSASESLLTKTKYKDMVVDDIISELMKEMGV